MRARTVIPAIPQAGTTRPKTILAGIAIGAALASAMMPARLSAQIPYQCPIGYYYYPNYGCLPLSYFYGPPAYPYANLGFGFFYGGNWNRGVPSGYAGRAYSGGGHVAAGHVTGARPAGGGAHGRR
jgi:hypothetical protein